MVMMMKMERERKREQNVSAGSVKGVKKVANVNWKWVENGNNSFNENV